MGEVKLTVTIPNGEDPGAGHLPDTGHMEASGLLPDAIKPHAKFKFTGPHEAELTLPDDAEASRVFAQKFALATKGFLYDWDNNPHNGKAQVVTESSVAAITGRQITDLVAAIRTSKNISDWYKFFVDRGELTLEQFQLVKSSGVFDEMVAHNPSFSQAADQLLRAYSQRLKSPIAIRYWDGDGNPETLHDLYWMPETTFNTHAEKLAALVAPVGGAKLAEEAKPAADLSTLLKPVTPDMITRYGDFIYHALLVLAAAPSGTAAQMVALKDDMVKNNFAEFAKGMAGSRITVDKTEYRLPTVDEISAFKMAHLGSNTIVVGTNSSVHYIGEENLRTIHIASQHVPVVVLHKSGGQCSVQMQSAFSANYNTGDYAPLDFFIPLDMESEFFALLGASPQVACVIERGSAGKTGRKFRISRIAVSSIQGTIDSIDQALALKAAGKKPELKKGTIPTENEIRISRAYALFSDFRLEDIAQLRTALTAFKKMVAKMVARGDEPPERGHNGMLGLGFPIYLEGLLLAAFLGVGGWFTHLLTKTDKFAAVWQKMRSRMGYVPDYLEDWHDKALNFAPYDCTVGNREQVIRRVMEALANFEGGVSRSIMLIGESSQGKTHMMKEIARRIALWRDYEDKIRKGIPAEKPAEYLNPALKTSVFYAIDFEKMGSEISLLGSWDHRVVHFKAWMKIHKEAVLYGDEATKMLGLGEVTTPDKKEGRRDLMNKIKEPVADGEYAMVLSTTRAEFDGHFVPYDPSQATLRRLHLVDLQTYTVQQVKEILGNLGDQMVSRDGLFKIEEAAIGQLVDRLIENGTQEFLLLNTAKNMLIDVANRMREAIRLSQAPEESEAGIDADMQAYVEAAVGLNEELKKLLARKRQVQIEMHNLNNRISQTNILNVPEVRGLKRQLKAMADEFLEINAKIESLTGPAIREKLAAQIARVEAEITKVNQKISETPRSHLLVRARLSSLLRRLNKHLAEIQGKLAKLVAGPDRRIVITAEMALAEEARQRKLSGKESHDSLVTEATALRQSIRTALLELRKYGHDLALDPRADVPMYDGETMADVVIRLKRLFETIVTYNTRVATNHKMPKAERVAEYQKLAALVATSGFDPGLDVIPPEPKEALAEAPDAPSPKPSPIKGEGRKRGGRVRRSIPTPVGHPVAGPSLRPTPARSPKGSPSPQPSPLKGEGRKTSAPAAPMPTNYADLLKALGMEDMVKRVQPGRLGELLALNVMGWAASDGRYEDLGTELWVLREWLEETRDPNADQKVREFVEGYCKSEMSLDVRGFVEDVLVRERVEEARRGELRDMMQRAEERVEREKKKDREGRKKK